MKDLIKRWNSRMPIFWHKVHKVSLWCAGLSAAGGVTDIIFGIPDNMLLFPDQVRFVGKAILMLGTLGAILSKLTRDENAEDKTLKP